MSKTLPTVVLVHGAWHGGWCWQRFTPHLEQRGFSFRAVELPSVGAKPGRAVTLSDDAAAVKAVLDDISGPVLLCGHSYAGMVISHGAFAHSNVERLFYICAFMPDAGDSLLSIGGGKNAPWINTLDGDLTLPDLEQTAKVFYGDCDTATQQWATRQLRPQSAASFAETVPQPAWSSIPSTYIVCANDMALPAKLQREVFAPRAAAVVELEVSHSPFVSKPSQLADAIVARY